MGLTSSTQNTKSSPIILPNSSTLDRSFHGDMPEKPEKPETPETYNKPVTVSLPVLATEHEPIKKQNSGHPKSARKDSNPTTPNSITFRKPFDNLPIHDSTTQKSFRNTINIPISEPIPIPTTQKQDFKLRIF
jgi:hypothetical protein